MSTAGQGRDCSLSKMDKSDDASHTLHKEAWHGKKILPMVEYLVLQNVDKPTDNGKPLRFKSA